MAPRKKTVLSPEQELKLVRKILKRDYLVNLADIVAKSRDQAIGVEAIGSVMVPKETDSPMAIGFQNARFDSSGFLPGGTGDGLIIPPNLGGRYDLVFSIRWILPGMGHQWSVEHAHSGYFFAKVFINGSGLDTNPLRSTTNATPLATGTTQNTSWHLNLQAGDTLEFFAWQSVIDEEVQADAAVCMTRLGSV